MTGYDALRKHAAWIDLSLRGRFRAKGEDRARLLHAMSTNHVQQMKPGDSCYAFFLTEKGRILADVNLLCLEDHFLLDTEAEVNDILYAHLDKYIIADDVTLEDARTDTVAIGLEGPKSAELAASIEGAVRAPFSVTGAPGVRFYIPPSEMEPLIAKLESLGAAAAFPSEVEAVRLEHFHPRFGSDISDRYLASETQLMHALHFSKGCYLGQEIVERVRSRGQVHRLLVPLYVQSANPPSPGTSVQSGNQAVGETTSSAYSPALKKSIAFAYVRAEHAKPGTRLAVAGAKTEVAAAKGT